MQEFIKITSQVIPLALNDIDTDMIIPAQYLTKVSREGYGEHLFQRLREQDPDFIFNFSHNQNSAILLTQKNFGCGSSREHAVWALQQAGIRVIIAESFSDIFSNNAAKNGLLLIALPASDIVHLMENADKAFTINLQQQCICVDGGNEIYFDYDPFRKQCLLKGQDDLDYLLEATRETIPA